MGDVQHINRNYKGNTNSRNISDYCKITIESYDPQNSLHTYALNPKAYNCKKTVYDGVNYYTSKNGTSSWNWYANKLFNEGKYRIEAIIFTTTTSNQYFNLELKNKTRTIFKKTKISTTSNYEGLIRLDLGTIDILSEDITINISGTKNAKFIATYFKKIREYSGDTNNIGELTLLEAKGTTSDKIGDDTLSFKILHKQGTYETGGFEEERNGSGLVFEYRDQVNAYLRDIEGNIKQVFGGYVSDAILSDDNLTIDLSCAGRGNDGNKRSIMNELTISGALPSNSLSHACKDLYDGIKYLAQGVELPFQLGNITTIINSIPNKNGFFWDLGINNNAKKVKASNASIWLNQHYIGIRNGRASKKVKTTSSSSKTVTPPSAVHGSCAHCNYNPKQQNTFKNYCPLCKKNGTLEWNPKGTAEGEWTCSACGADCCAKCGSEKLKKKRGTLTKSSTSSSSSNSSETKEQGIPGQVQTVTLWDSAWNKTKEKIGYNLNNYPVFYLRYGMGKKGYNEDNKTYIPKQFDATGNVVPGTGRWVTNKKASGFNTEQPGKWHIELHFTKAPRTPMNNKTAAWNSGSTNEWNIITIEFTDTDITSRSDRGSSITTSGAVNRINPIWSYNTFRTVSFSITDWLSETNSNKYLRKVVLKYFHNSDSVLYEESNNADFKMGVQHIGFRQGEAYAPEVISTNGQKINDTVDKIKETLRLDSYWVYGPSRSQDILFFRKKDNTISKYELEESNNGNIIGVSSISYPVIGNLCNSVTKIYKVPDGYYGFVSAKDVDNLLRFGEHQNLEVLNEDTGYNYANYLAKSDSEHMQNIGYSYTIIAEGYRDVHIGESIVCTLLNSKLDDIQPIQSIEWEYNPEKRPMVRSTYGLGEMSDKLRAKNTLKNIRKGLNEKRTVFSGGSAEVVYDGL